MAPFAGTIEFKLSLRAFDERVVRKARATYSYTPSWSYYDTIARVEQSGSSQHLDLGLLLLAIPRANCSRVVAPAVRNKPYWLPMCKLLAPGVLRPRVYDHLFQMIDSKARDADRAARLEAGLPVTPQPEFI